MLEIIHRVDKQNPVVLMGDLNAEPGDPELAALFKVFGDILKGEKREGLTFPAEEPTKRIDYILHSGHFTVSDAYV